jgi:hypothetical protein
MIPPTLANLAGRAGGVVRVACDSEFVGPHTLTVQFAARAGDDIAVQVYHSTAIPPPPVLRCPERLLPAAVRGPRRRVIVRPTKTLDRDLSPARVLGDLFDLPSLEPVDKSSGDLEAYGVVRAAPVALVFTMHYGTADFFRIFGQHFFADLIERQIRSGTLVVLSRKLLAFKQVHETCHRFVDPVLEYARYGGLLYPIRVGYFDTNLAYVRGSLDDLALTFLGVGKSADLTPADKQDMLATFLKKPRRAYTYAVRDSLLTLGVEERMRAEDRRMYEQLGFEAAAIPPLRPTLGSRVADTITRSIARSAAGSVLLSQRGKPLADGRAGKPSLAKVKSLLTRGSGQSIADERASAFGRQTGETHGGLLFSRSPTRLFHDAVGMFRDVDLSGCYASVLGSMNLYAGRPIIHEPGGGAMRLSEGVAFVREHAAGRDAWVLKVSGPITAAPNVLIPSTRGALTHANYQSRAARKRARSRRHGLVFDWLFEAGKSTGNATTYTDVVEAGFVAWPTWLMIQAMPPALRKDYEDLEVETILFYPRAMVADTGPGYDALVERFRRGQTPWHATIDMERLEQVIVRHLDDDHVALRFDVGGLARTISEFRKEAKEVHGKGSGADLAWKQHANSMYGVAASRHLITNNVVCANVVTATARALAFAMQMSLNGVQVITDGCTYRCDQVPAGTFAGCLAAAPEYPIRRPDAGVAHLPPGSVPGDDAAFTDWYRQHAQRFFGVAGADYDWLFGLHRLEHKECGDPGRAAFDGLCCDGSGNYVKLLRDGGGWEIADFKARSFKREAKAVLGPWVVRACEGDRYDGPPPVTESPHLLTYKEACRGARKALDALEAPRSKAEREDDPVMVYYPLGLEQRRVQAYKVIKRSAFLFRNPQQEEAFSRAMKKFADACGCGLEALALRRAGGGRRQGSLADVAEAVYRLIRAGELNPTRALNLTRSYIELERVRRTQYQELLNRKAGANERLVRAIDGRTMDDPATLTGLYVQRSDIVHFAQAPWPRR